MRNTKRLFPFFCSLRSPFAVLGVVGVGWMLLSVNARAEPEPPTPTETLSTTKSPRSLDTRGALANLEHPALHALSTSHGVRAVAKTTLTTSLFTNGFRLDDVDGDHKRDLVVADCRTIQVWPYTTLQHKTNAPPSMQRQRPKSNCVHPPAVLPGGYVAHRTTDGMDLFAADGTHLQSIDGAVRLFSIDDKLDAEADLWWASFYNAQVNWAHLAQPRGSGFAIGPFQQAQEEVLGDWVELLHMPSSPNHVIVVDHRLPPLVSTSRFALEGGAWLVSKDIARPDDDVASSRSKTLPVQALRAGMESPAPNSAAGDLGDVAGVVGDSVVLGMPYTADGDQYVWGVAFPIRDGVVGRARVLSARIPGGDKMHWTGNCRVRLEVVAIEDYDANEIADALVVQHRQCFKVVDEETYSKVAGGNDGRFQAYDTTVSLPPHIKGGYAIASKPSEATFVVVNDLFQPVQVGPELTPEDLAPGPPFPLAGWTTLPPPQGERRECLEMSIGARDHHVAVVDGQLSVTSPATYTPRPREVTLVVDGDTLVGKDRGKWPGGKLVHRKQDGDLFVKYANVHLLLAHQDGVMALGGRRHGTLDVGHVWWAERYDGTWEVTHEQKLKHRPVAATSNGKEAFVVVGRDILRIRRDVQVVHHSRWDWPYATSIARTPDGVLWVGLRHHVVRVEGDRQSWYTPTHCRRLERHEGGCQCRPGPPQQR